MLIRSLQAWLYGEGEELPVEIEYNTTLAQDAYTSAKAWDEGRNSDVEKLHFKSTDLDTFNSNQKGAPARLYTRFDIGSWSHLQNCAQWSFWSAWRHIRHFLHRTSIT